MTRKFGEHPNDGKGLERVSVALREEQRPSNQLDGRTHYEGCWRDHPDCARDEIERLRAAVARLEAHVIELRAERDAMTRVAQSAASAPAALSARRAGTLAIAPYGSATPTRTSMIYRPTRTTSSCSTYSINRHPTLEVCEVNRFTKIGEDGKPLPDDAEHWVIVLDDVSGLMWTVEEIAVKGQKQALKVVKDLRVGGFSDWAVPALEPLFLLADRTKASPAIDTRLFPRCKSDWYWTSTPSVSSPGDYAWCVDFDSGDANWAHQGYEGFVRAVRASQ